MSLEALSRELRSAGLGLGLVFIKDQYSVLYCSLCHLKHCRMNSDQVVHGSYCTLMISCRIAIANDEKPLYFVTPMSNEKGNLTALTIYQVGCYLSLMRL